MVMQVGGLSELKLPGPPSYIDPSVNAWGSVVEIWNRPDLQSKALASAGAIVAVVVTALNTLTMTAKVFRISMFNNMLDGSVRALYGRDNPAKHKIARLKFDGLERTLNTEVKKIGIVIHQSTNANELVSPFQLTSSRQVIDDAAEDLGIKLPKDFHKGFLEYIFEENGSRIQTGFDEAKQALSNPEKIKGLADIYQNNLMANQQAYKALADQKLQYDQEIVRLKNSLKDAENPISVKESIKRLEDSAFATAKKMSALIPSEDLKALSYSWGRDSYFAGVVKKRLLARIAFLDSIKRSEELYIPSYNQGSSWSKIALVAISTLSVAAAGWHIYNNGVPTKEQLFNAPTAVYEKAQDVWKNTPSYSEVKAGVSNMIPSYSEVKAGVSNIWENMTSENIGSQFSKAWEGLTLENAKHYIKNIRNRVYTALFTSSELGNVDSNI